MASNLRIFSGSSHPDLAKAICSKLKIKLSELTISKFACGEIYAKPVESVRGDDVFIIQTGTGNVNEELIELFIILDSMKRSFARSIHVVIPYYPYARQDRVASPREPITAKLMAKLIEEAGADHVITMQIHSEQQQGFFGFPIDHLNARKLFAKYFQNKKIKDLVVVAPDAGAAKDADRLARLLGVTIAVMSKMRPGFNKAEITSLVGDVKGKNCIIFD
ncbi:ribose-phosphate pyrophosphokinase, partial [Candidatus Peregrinibacteria bacterium RIFOXYB12_FULL_41_12]